MARTTVNGNPTPELRIDMEKMLRFSRWFFADDADRENRAENRAEEPPNNPESLGQSAA